MPLLDYATLSVVERVLGVCVCGVAPCCVASLACPLAISQSLFSSLTGSYRIVTVFPFLRSALIDL